MENASLIGQTCFSLFFSILDEARQVAELCSDPSQADAILKAANEIEAMAAALVELRAQGQVGLTLFLFVCLSVSPSVYILSVSVYLSVSARLCIFLYLPVFML